MPSNKNPNTWSAEELQDEIDKLNTERARLKEQVRELAGLRDGKLASEAAQARVSSMTELERKELAAALAGFKSN